MTPPMQLEFPEPAKAKRKRKLPSQLDCIEDIMSDGGWYVLGNSFHDADGRLHNGLKYLLRVYDVWASEAGISARLRDLRNIRGYTVDSRPVAKGRKLYEYRVTR